MKRESKNKRVIKIAAILVALVFTAQACGLGGNGKQGERIQLTWWKPFDDPRYVQPLIQAFQKEYPNIRITYVQKDIETYEDELLDALASGQGPDIFSIHNDWLPKHIEKIAPFPSDIINLRQLNEEFIEVLGSDLVSGEQIYALPLSIDVLALYYNRDSLASAGIPKAPPTWGDLVNLTPRLTVQDSLGNFQHSAIALGTADNINRASDILALLMLQNGTPLYTVNNTASTLDQNVRDEQGEAFSPGQSALEFYTQFANPSKVTYNWNQRSNNSIEAFANGQVSMILSYSYLRETLLEKAPFLNYAVAPVPQIDEKLNRINFANYWAEAVSAQSENQRAAQTFLRFITNAETLPKYYEARKQVSPRIDVLETQLDDPEIGVFAENALSARSLYKPNSDSVDNIFIQMINDVVLRNVAAGAAVNAAAQKINLLLRNF